jgi:putative salt-induced outer membrane protein YdiY
MRRLRSRTLPLAPVALALALSAAPARIVCADEPLPPPWKLTADLGYVNTSGNTRVQTLTAGDKLEHHRGRWLLTQDAAAVWGTTDGVENAGRYGVGLRADYALSKRLGLYGLGSWRRNTFAGISRQFDEGGGAVFHALVPNPQQLDLELGLGAAQRRAVTGVEDNFATGRLAALYRYYFQEKAYAEGHGIYLANFKNSDDYEYDLNAALVAPFSTYLAVKLNYNYHYRNLPPIGFGHWDSTFSAGIQGNW